jgi:hypothetical protein
LLSPNPAVGRPIAPEYAQTGDIESDEEVALRKKFTDQVAQVRRVVKSIPEVEFLGTKIRYWDIVFSYKGKRFAVDVRLNAPTRLSSLDDSIKNLVSYPLDCLIFVFGSSPNAQIQRLLERKNRLMGNRLKYTSADDENTLHNEILAILESTAADLPSNE